MSAKGLFDTTTYVLNDFYTPDTYTVPAESSGTYTVSDYVDIDYTLKYDQELQSQFTITANAEIINPGAALLIESTVTVDAIKVKAGSSTQEIAFTFTARAQPFQRAAATMQVALSIDTAKPNAVRVGVIIVDAITTQVQLAGYLLELEPEDYSWDTFAIEQYDEITWDEWFADKWDSTAILFTTTSVSKATGGFLAQGSAAIDHTFSSSIPATGRIRSSLFQSSMLSQFAIDKATGNVVFTGTTSADTVFSVASNYIRFRDQPNPIVYTSLLQSQQQGNATFGPSPNIIAIFASSQNANVTFDPSKSLLYQFDVSSNANAFFASTKQTYTFFYSTLSDGFLISLVDPYNTFKVLQEIKTFVLPMESRVIDVLQETRVNSVSNETRIIDALQELRAYRIYKPQLTNRSSIPRVRTDL
jgi:hypothetical protein